MVQKYNSYRNPQPKVHHHCRTSFLVSYIITMGLYTADLFTRRPSKCLGQNWGRFGFKRCSIIFALLFSNSSSFAYLLSRQHKPVAAAARASLLTISNSCYSMTRMKDFCITPKRFISCHCTLYIWDTNTVMKTTINFFWQKVKMYSKAKISLGMFLLR